MKKNGINKKAMLFIILFLIANYVIAFHLPLTADDFNYSFSRLNAARLNHLFDVFASAGHEYMTWNGRILGIFLTQLTFLTKNALLFRFLFPWFNLIIIYEMYVFTTLRTKIDQEHLHVLALAALLFYLPHILVLNQTLFWITAYWTYVFPLILILFILIFIRGAIQESTVHSVFNKPLVLFTVGLCSCLFMEHYSLVVFSLALCLYGFKAVKTRSLKPSAATFALLLGSLMGLLILFRAPGLSVRSLTDDFANFPLMERLYFGWTRFVYTHFFLNQKIFLILAVILIAYVAKQKIKMSKKVVMICLLLTLVASFFIVAYKLSFGYPALQRIISALTKPWAFYEFDMAEYLPYSLVVVYSMFVLFVGVFAVAWKKKDPLIAVLYLAALMCNLCFILTDKACERTQYISFFLLSLICLIIYDNYLSISIRSRRLIWITACIALIMLQTRFMINYIHQYQIFRSNERALLKCRMDNCSVVYVKPYDSKYVFNSELDFEDQDNWVLHSLRRYYCLHDEVQIRLFSH